MRAEVLRPLGGTTKQVVQCRQTRHPFGKTARPRRSYLWHGDQWRSLEINPRLNLCHRFLLSAPIEGYGMPSIYLSLLRQVCSNGMVGYSPTFRSTLTLGRGEDNAIYSIVRVLDGFASDEGYAALRQRFEAATKSWASVYEAQSLHRLLVKLLALPAGSGIRGGLPGFQGPANAVYLVAVHGLQPWTATASILSLCSGLLTAVCVPRTGRHCMV